MRRLFARLTAPQHENHASTAALGAAKERLAESYLNRQGLRTLARNHRCRQGEIDLVMRDGETLVFVEVRFRRSERFGAPAETVGALKRRRLIAAASHYLQRHPSASPCRFDVLAISGEDQIKWIRQAFSLEYDR